MICPTKIASIAKVPATDGKHLIIFDPAWDKATRSSAAVGNPANINLLAYHNPQAISIPADALEYGADGWTVGLKLANGNTERRQVKRGRESGKQVEILEGLEAGQVIVTP